MKAKMIKVLFIFSASLMLTACGLNDNSIVGTWKLQDNEGDRCPNFVQFSDDDIFEIIQDNSEYIEGSFNELKENDKYLLDTGNETVELQGVRKQDSLTLNNDDDDDYNCELVLVDEDELSEFEQAKVEANTIEDTEGLSDNIEDEEVSDDEYLYDKAEEYVYDFITNPDAREGLSFPDKIGYDVYDFEERRPGAYLFETERGEFEIEIKLTEGESDIAWAVYKWDDEMSVMMRTLLSENWTNE